MPTAVTSFTTKSTAQGAQPNGIALAPQTNNPIFQTGLTFSSGTGSNQINRLVVQPITIAAGATCSIDLTAGTYDDSSGNSGILTDLNNEAVTFSALKYLRLRLIDVALGSTLITLDRTAGNAFPGCAGEAVAAGTGSGFEGPMEWCNPSAAGEVVTDSTTDILSIINGDGSHDASVLLILGGLA